MQFANGLFSWLHGMLRMLRKPSARSNTKERTVGELTTLIKCLLLLPIRCLGYEWTVQVAIPAGPPI